MDTLSVDKKIKLIYPPSSLFQRGEERCQANIDSSTATSVRACNDLGYVASVLRKNGYSVSLKDYQTERLPLCNLISDIEYEKPDVIFISVTNGSIFEDIQTVNIIKTKFPQILIILKGAIFFNSDNDLLNQLDLSNVDFLIGTEAEQVIVQLLNAYYNNYSDIKNIKGILFKENDVWIKNDFENIWETDLDKLPFPARDLMNNSLYLRPDTQEVQATITTSIGCPSSCIFCLTPYISGKKLRLRSVESVFEEIKECYEKYDIENFFFKADTFTYNKEWTKKLCELIISSNLNSKINWVANSRVNTVDLETLQLMKKAGCWLIAFGFESGSQKSLDMMQKGTTVEQNIEAMQFAKSAGLKVFGFYLIGFPWENIEDLKKTQDLIFKQNADFIELHLATPFYGTELYKMAKQEELISESILGKDYFDAPSIPTKHLSIDKLQSFRKKVLLKFYLRPIYIFNKICSVIAKPKILKNYVLYGIKLVKNCIKSR